MDYYKELFVSSNPGDFDEVLDGVDRVVTKDMNSLLFAEFTVAEVKRAIHQMGPLKALGPDGMSLIFYQKYWHIVGPTVTEEVLSCLKDGALLDKINHPIFV